MSFIILPKNTAKDAVLVEQKSGTTTKLDDSTPIEVNVQQPVDVSFEVSLLNNILISNRRIFNEITESVVQLKILNKYMQKWHGEEITHEDIEHDNH
jgi:hypothetical protein